MHGQKGYKLYDIERKVTLVSRDVFHESIFPYKGEQTDPIPCSLPLPLNTSDTDANSDLYTSTNVEEKVLDHIAPELRRYTRTI